MFAWRSDSPEAVAGLDASELISLALLGAAGVGAWALRSDRGTASPSR